MKFWQEKQANFPFYLCISTANVLYLPNNCQMTLSFSGWCTVLSNSASPKYEAWKGCCVALFLSSGLSILYSAMESAVVYLGVRFGTGRGEALRLFDCFIMVIYMAIYLCILCYVCHYMYTSECLFVCVHVLVCVRLSKEGSVFGPPCELGWVTAWASGLSQQTHTRARARTHTDARTHISNATGCGYRLFDLRPLF